MVAAAHGRARRQRRHFVAACECAQEHHPDPGGDPAHRALVMIDPEGGEAFAARQFGEKPPGVEAVFGDSVNNFRMSTGVTHGDRQQASHFKDDRALGVHLGIMNPTLARDVAFGISPADLRVLDLIGWDVTPVPLPPAVLLLAPALALLAGHRRRRG